MALLRVVSTLERDPCVRSPDFLAKPLLADGPVLRLLLWWVSLRPVNSLVKWLFERVGAGTYWMEIARVKHYDEILLSEVARGIRQVVVLGTGLDSRAYRFQRELRDVRVIEVDRPEMIAHKQVRVHAALGKPAPSYVSYLPLDLSTDDLASGLVEAGLDPSLPVLVLWIGVSMYLDRPAVSSVLSWVAECPAGSSVGFDYFDQAFLEDASVSGAPRWAQRIIELSGERFTFGLDPKTVHIFLNAHGLSMRSHLRSAEIEQEYLRQSNGEVAGRSFAPTAFVHAAVA